MNDDYLINLLPSEYQPKPEFKGFPVFVIVLLALTGWVIFLNYNSLNTKLQDLSTQKEDQLNLVTRRKPLAMEALHVQARSRMLFSYAVTIWSTLHQNPPWVEVYNEIEESLPEGMWIETLQMTGGGERKWPSYVLSGKVAGKEPETVLMFYESMLSKDSKFEKVSISGYTFVEHEGQDAVAFNMRFGLKKTSFMGF